MLHGSRSDADGIKWIGVIKDNGKYDDTTKVY